MFCVVQEAANYVTSARDRLDETGIQMTYLYMVKNPDAPIETMFLKFMDDDVAAKIQERATLFPRIPSTYFINRAIELLNSGKGDMGERVMGDFDRRWDDKEIIEWAAVLDDHTRNQMMVHDAMTRTAYIIKVERGMTKDALNDLKDELVQENPMLAAEMGIAGTSGRNIVQGNNTVN